jgi:predicted RNA methylase
VSELDDLSRAIRRAEFTPGVRHIEGLLTLLGGDDEEVAAAVERVLPRAGARGLAVLRTRIHDVAAPVVLRTRLARVLARVGGDEARAVLLAQADDPEARVRRAVAVALGKMGDGGDAGDVLAARLDEERDASVRRALVESLGKLGGKRAEAALAAIVPGDDVEMARLLGKARLMVARGGAAAAANAADEAAGAVALESSVDLSKSLGGERRLWLHTRAGLAELLAEEVRTLPALKHVRVRSASIVEAMLVAPPAELFAARLWDDFGFVLAADVAADGPEAQASTLVETLCASATRAILAGATRGAWRFRLDWVGGGPRRALTWRVAAEVASRAPDLVNAPRQAPWEVRAYVPADDAEDAPAVMSVELVPQRFDDPRFAYRTGDVPAASHPTIAAALARVAGVEDGDVVWDPFLGSGAELIERARLGSYAALYGTDVELHALEVSKANLAAGGVKDALLAHVDSCAWTPPRPPTLIITNPPMGRRVHRGDVGPLLDRFLGHAARVLAPGGRLVWASPLPARTAAMGAKLGLRVEPICGFDMGGFSAQMQRLSR